MIGDKMALNLLHLTFQATPIIAVIAITLKDLSSLIVIVISYLFPYKI